MAMLFPKQVKLFYHKLLDKFYSAVFNCSGKDISNKIKCQTQCAEPSTKNVLELKPQIPGCRSFFFFSPLHLISRKHISLHVVAISILLLLSYVPAITLRKF